MYNAFHDSSINTQKMRMLSNDNYFLYFSPVYLCYLCYTGVTLQDVAYPRFIED